MNNGQKQPNVKSIPSNLERALIDAINSAHAAEQYGLKIGYPVRFTPADIRAMAISVLIGMDRNAA